MEDHDPTRRTALKALALLGVGATGSAGVAAARNAGVADQPDGGAPIPSGLFVAPLTPQPDVDSDAHGIAMVQQRQDALKFVLVVANIENATMAHIHEDEVLGPIAVWLYDHEAQSQQLEEGTFTGILDAGTITDEDVEEGSADDAESESVDDLLELMRAGEAYVNVHTEEYPSGVIAGRLRHVDPRAMMGPGGY